MTRYPLMLKPMLFCIAMATSVSAQAGPAPPRFDFSSIIPHNWRRAAPPQGVNAQAFVSPSGDAWIAFKAEPASRPVDAELKLLRGVPGAHITYERQGQTWIVVSGLKGSSRIFYRKAMLACDGRAWHYLEFEYPAMQKRAFDDFVTLSSAALGAYGKSGCQP